jgi:hypothetical protein
VLVKVLSASADSGSDWKPWFAAAAAMANGGDLSARGGGWFGLSREHISFIGVVASHCAHGLPRRARGPRPRPTRLVGGERGWTGGYSDARPSTNAGAPRGGPDFKGGLGARNALGRCGTSVGAGPGRRGRRDSTLYHFHKVHMVFFSTDFAQITAKL